MKKYFLLFVAAIGLMVASCSKDDDKIIVPEPTPTPTPTPDPTPDPEVVVTQDMIDNAMYDLFDKSNIVEFDVTEQKTLSIEEMANMIFGDDGTYGNEDLSVAKQAFIDSCKVKSDSIANVTGENSIAYAFDNYKFKYTTVDENNNPLTLSAWMCWPCIPYFKTPQKAEHIVFVCPYTHTKWDECATESNGGVEAMTFWNANLFIIPDGQGFGANKDAQQTYLAHHLHAQQYYDCLVAADRIYRKNGQEYEYNWDLHVVGASQGGGDALALHKYLETHDCEYDLSAYYDSGKASDMKIADEICKIAGVNAGTKNVKIKLMKTWRLAFSAVCCGPYNPEATLKTYLEWGKLSYPCVLPMVLKTMLAINPELASTYEEEEFYSELYKKHKNEIDKVLIEKSMQSLELNLYMRELLALEGEPNGAPEFVPIDRILSEEMLKADSKMRQDIMAALAKENLTSGWAPERKCYVYYCEKDEVVPYKNSELLLEFLGDKAVKMKLDADSHMGACVSFFGKEW